MKIVFAGTPRFAEVALQALLEAGHDVGLVLTQPDRGAGRGRQIRLSPVKRLAERRGLPLLQPASLRDSAISATLAQLRPDAMVVAAYGLLIPGSILALPRMGGLNIHASLLPRWRGAAPIQRALIAGDATTGISIMQMDEGLDTGPILLQEPIPITPQDTAGTLHDRLASLGARLIVKALASPHAPRPQNHDDATYAAKLSKDEARIDWAEPATGIERKVRAFDPEPGAFTHIARDVLKVWRCSVETGASGTPGTVLDVERRGVVVACGEDALRLSEMQRAGGKRLPVQAFLAGYPIERGARLG